MKSSQRSSATKKEPVKSKIDSNLRLIKKKVKAKEDQYDFSGC
jgi:hypothetical protein